jgi:hypothetical protein
LESIVNLKFPALVTVLLLTSGLAMASEPAKAETAKNVNSAAGCPGAPAVKREPAPAASSGPRTRAEVHAEAVEAAKEDRSTFSKDLDFLKN